MGKADIAIGEFELARSHFEAALRAFQTFEMNAEVLGCLEDEAFLAQTCGRAEDAARLYAAAEYQRERRALIRSPRSGRRRQDVIAAARANLGDTAFETAWSEGRAWELEEAIRCALAVAPPRICTSAPALLL